MKHNQNDISGLEHYFKFQKIIAERVVWPYSFKEDSLYRWRAFILSSILLSALLFGSFAFISAMTLLVKENAWGLAFVDFLGLMLGFIFLFARRIKFEVRASITLLMFYVIGIAVILSVGPLSGGPAWLFAFAVLSGVLVGNYAAFVAILMNGLFLSILGIMISTGKFGNEFPLFNSTQTMISAGINFIVLNAVTAASVSALVKGVSHTYRKKEDLANSLKAEQLQLIEAKQGLELEIKNRKQTEKALLKSETKYRRIYNNILNVYYETSIDGIILEISPSIVKHSQYTREELIGKSIYDIYANPADREKLIEILHNHGSVRDYEVILKYKDGTLHTSSVNIELIKDDNHNPIKLVGIFRDITEQKQADEMLRKSEEKFRTAFQTSPNAITITNIEDGKYIDVNKGFTKILGYSQEDVIGKSSVALNIWNNLKDREFLRSGIKKYGAVENLEAEFKGKNGQIITGLMSARTLNIKDKKIFLAVTQDITERKRAEDALNKKTKFLDKIIETSAMSMWISDEKGTAIRANPACLKLYGATEEEVIGKYNLFQDSVLEKKGFMPMIKDLFQKGEPASFIIDYDFASVDHVDVENATHKTLNTVHTPVFDSNGKVSNIIVQAIDFTEIKQAQKDIIKAQKIAAEQKRLALVGQIAGKMAHDFNNILGIIMGNTELSLLDCKDIETRKTLELIFEQTLRGKNLTKNLVAFAKDQEPKQVFFRISEKIDLVVSLMKKDLEGIEFIKEDKPGVPGLLADPGMIEHTLVNLIQNSIHATSMNKSPQISIRTYCSDKNICFEIEDNGCGVSKKHMKNIYEPSFSLKGSNDVTGSYERHIKGTGYGMANVKKYIEQHKGKISVDSVLGSGTKFTISLPVINKELTNDEKKELREEITYFEKHILLIEDETDISNVQYKILTTEPCNHKVEIANTGQIAMDLFDRTDYDFISLDYVLPGGINGMDIYHHVRKTDKNIPILFVSGNIEFLESIKALKQKDVIIDHISKPCQHKDYINRINKLLEQANAAQQSLNPKLKI